MADKKTAAQKAFAAHPDAFILVFTKSNAYRDKINNINDRSEYMGQNKKDNFDMLMGDNNIPMFLIDNAIGGVCNVVGRCIARDYNAVTRVDGKIPSCHFILRRGNLTRVQDSNVDRQERHCFRKKFFRDYGLTKLSGHVADGIILVKSA